MEHYKIIKIGMRVRVLYPEYVAGREGIIRTREAQGRWLISLKSIAKESDGDSFLLSLEESDFEIIPEED